ncbi:MAG: amidohydrolase [Acidimicrobiaceae bacterium]|nr:amidohydrolase [Acidimicrobiaceae bacterium]
MSPAALADPIRYVGADRLLVSGRPEPNAAGVLLGGGDIVAVIGRDERPSTAPDGLVHHYEGATLLPGLIDAHVHLCLVLGEDLTREPDEALVASSVAAGRRAAAGMLASGVTSARDLGGRTRSAQVLRDALEPGSGPSLSVAGRPVTAPGGHFAAFGLAVRGPRAMREAVDQLAGEGADLVKVMLTGGNLTPGSAPGRAQFELAEVEALTERARARNLRVAAHAHGTVGIELAVRAGVDTIEHCSFLADDGAPGELDTRLVEAMVRAGQVVVVAAPLPAGLAGKAAETLAGGPSDGERTERLLRAWANARRLVEAGVRVGLGSDSMFGQFADDADLAYRAEAMVVHGGWEPAAVVELMTQGSSAALGASERLGRLRAGSRADLLVVDGDPSRDIGDLRRVRAVYRAGRLVHGEAPLSEERR